MARQDRAGGDLGGDLLCCGITGAGTDSPRGLREWVLSCGQGGKRTWWGTVSALRALTPYHMLTTLYRGITKIVIENIHIVLFSFLFCDI